MSSIDSRILSLKFDASGFERGAAATLSGLKRLQEALRLPGSRKGLDDVGRAAQGVRLDHLGNQANVVSARFSAMSAVALGALARIGSAAISAGANLAKSFTVQPLMDGMREYEAKMGSIQTILANTMHDGTNLKQVNAALDGLNHYADKTIYSFGDMTDAIGKFTAAGLSLDVSTTAIKGIANLGAISGSTNTQVQTAMHQLSQALASGKVGLQDWNSVVNAGMGGKVFQDQLVKTAEAMGINAKEMIKAKGSFRESISAEAGGQSWLTSEVLSRTLQQLSGDLTDAQLKAQGFTAAQIKGIRKTGEVAQNAATQVKTGSQLIDTLKEAAGSGWATTWQHIIGDFEQAKAMWTSVNNVLSGAISQQADARNAMFAEWAKFGGRDDLLRGLSSAFQGLMTVVGPIKDAFRDIFPATSGRNLAHMTEQFADLMAKMRLSDSAMSNLRSTFRGLFAIIDIGRMFVVGLAKGLLTMIGGASKAGGSLLEFTGHIGDFLVKIRDAIKNGKLFDNFFTNIGGTLGKIVGKAGDALGSLMKFAGLASASDGLAKFGNAIVDILSSLGSTAMKGLSELGDAFAQLDISRLLSGLVAGGIGVKIVKKIFQDIREAISGDGKTSLMDAIKGVFESISGTFESASGVLDNVTESFKTMQNSLKAATLVEIGVAIALIAGSISTLSNIDGAGLTRGLAGVTIVLAELFIVMTGFTKILSPANLAGMMKVGASMVLLAAAVRILASAVKELSSLSWEELIKGLGSVILLMGALTLASLAMSKTSGSMMRGAAGLIAFSVAIKILASAVRDISSLSVGELVKGLVGVGVLLAQVALLSKFTAGTKGMVSMGAGLLLLSGGIRILASAVALLGSLSLAEIGKGLLALGGSLVIVAGAIKLMPKNMISTGLGLMAISVAMNALALALAAFGGMSMETIGKGLLALGGSLTVLAIALNLMTGTLAGSAALLIAVAAVNALVPALVILGSMSVGTIATALIALAGSFAVIGLAAALITPVIPAVLALAAALLAMGAAMALTGVGIAAFGVGLQTVATVIGSAVSGIWNWIQGLLTSLLQLSVAFVQHFAIILGVVLTHMPQIIAAMFQLGQGILNSIIRLAPLASQAFVAVISAMLNAVAQSAPKFVSTMVTVLTAMLNGIATMAPRFVNTMVIVLTAVLNGIAKMAPRFVNTMVVVITAMLNGINRLIPLGLKTMVNLMLALLKAIDQVAPRVISTIIKMIGLMLDALARSVPQFASKAGQIIAGFLNGIARQMPAITQAAGNLAVAFINGLNSQVPRVSAAATNLARTVVRTVVSNLVGSAGSVLSAAVGIGSNICNGMIRGIQRGMGAVAGWARSVASKALSAAKGALGIHSPSKKFEEVGYYADQGLAKGLRKNSGIVETEATELGESALYALSQAMREVGQDIEDNFNPTLTPVIDLSGAEKSAQALSSMLSASDIQIGASVNAANIIANKKTPIDIKAESKSSEAPRIVQMTQNNYSPKALTTTEIYRQTRNQLGNVQEVLKKA